MIPFGSRSRGRRARAAMVAVAIALVSPLLPGPATAQGPGESLSAKIRGELRDFARARAGVAAEAVEIPDLTYFDLESLDPETADIRLSANGDNEWRGTVPVTVAVWSQGEPRKRGVVTLRVAERRTAWVAARDFLRGDSIGPGDLRVAEVEVSKIPSDAISNPAAIRDHVARRNFDEGSIVRDRWVERRSRIERGEIVVIRLQRGALRIEGRGTAREGGAVGDWVRVRNIDSRRELLGRVARDGAVDVGF